MATIQELEAALQKAHAAGNVAHARVLANAIREARGAQQSAPKEWQPRQRSVADLRQAAREQNPAEGMSWLQQFAAGAGKSLVDTGRGLKQLAHIGMDFVDPRERELSDLITGGDPSRQAADRAEQDMIDRRDGSLMGSGGGITGNITGSVAQVLSPAVLLKGAAATPQFARYAPALNTASRAAMPTTIRGAAAQGAVQGFIQPVGTEDSRLVNTGAGLAFGAGGAAVPRAAGALYRAGRRSLMTGSGAERRLAEILRAEAENPTALMTPQPSSIPGVQRTLAEETLDPGLARLERNARSTGRGFDTLDRTNNAARVAAIRGFAKDDAAVAAAIDARTKATTPLYAAAEKVDGVDTSRLLTQIKRLEKAQEGRPAVQGALGSLRNLLTREVPDAERTKAAIGPLQAFINADRTSATNREAAKEAIKQIRAGEWPTVQFTNGAAGTRGVGASYDAGKDALAEARKALNTTHVGHDKMSVLSNVRLTIGDMLSGKFGGDAGAALAGSRAIMAVKSGLDRVAAKASPEFAQATQAFRQHSADINRMQIGQSLIGQKSGSAVLDPVTGEQVLLPASFSSRARNLDKVAAEATGFRKARAADYLKPDDLKTIAGVQDDLQRKAFAATAGSGGNSQTFERMALNDRVAGGLMAKLPFIGKAFEYLDAVGQQRLRAQLSEVLANPQQARALLARLPAEERRVVENALVAGGGTLGAAALPSAK